MTELERVDFNSPAIPSGSEDALSASIWREMQLVGAAGQGIADSARDAVDNPGSTLFKAGTAFAIGAGLALMSKGRCTAPLGKAIAYSFAVAAIKDLGMQAGDIAYSARAVWNSDQNLDAHKTVVGRAIGNTVVDGLIFSGGAVAGVHCAPKIGLAGRNLAAVCNELSAPQMRLSLAMEGPMPLESHMFAVRKKPAGKSDAVLAGRPQRAQEVVEEPLAAKRERVVDETIGAIDKFLHKHGAYESPILTADDIVDSLARMRTALLKPGGSENWTPSFPEFKRIIVSSPSRNRDIFGFKGDIAVVVENGTDTVSRSLTKELNALIHRATKRQWILDERL